MHVAVSRSATYPALRGRVYFIRSILADGRDVYYFLQVSPSKEKHFRKAMRGNAMVDYRHYGSILASGYGHTPEPYILAIITRDYGYSIRGSE